MQFIAKMDVVPMIARIQMVAGESVGSLDGTRLVGRGLDDPLTTHSAHVLGQLNVGKRPARRCVLDKNK